jgi:GNAT superfamily N-acetyltransferase
MRKFHDDEDYWRVRTFLREVFMLNHRRDVSWNVCRWDYWRWHGLENLEKYRLEEACYLWETATGEIAAVLNPENWGDVHMQLHPSFRTAELEEEMIATAEEHLALAVPGGRWKLTIWAHAQDALRAEILARRGFRKVEGAEHQRRRSMQQPIPVGTPSAGYTIRTLGDADELPARSWASWKAFHPEEPDQKYTGWEWYRNIQRAPLYRRDLDLVAVAPDGEIASFCTIWYDDENRMGLFEPVATLPNHLRRGLGAAEMSEGLHRLKRMGATLALVSSYSVPAGALYASLGFTEYDLYEPWVKEALRSS